MQRKVFVTGTDTEVGKTHVSSLAVTAWRSRGIRVGVYKPVASDCRRVASETDAVENGHRQAGQRPENTRWYSEDADRLWVAAGKPLTPNEVCPQCFAAPLAPPEAAALENRKVDEGLLVAGAAAWEPYERLLIEGAGGLMSPVSESMLNLHLIQRLAPTTVVLVAADRLGVIHQVLSTIAAAEHHGVKIDRVVLSRVESTPDRSVQHNAQAIRRWTKVPVEDPIQHGQKAYAADW
ncbi:MAG: dethiobiotin synthase [Planctomycetota bacterium]